ELEATIKAHNPEVDIIECAHQPRYLRRYGVTAAASGTGAGADATEPLTFLKGKRVLAFSGIATPESFEKFLRDLGALIVARERFLDHYRYVNEDLEALFELARKEDAECLVTTEKDAVRIPENYPCPLPLYYLRLEIEIIRGAADFDEAVGRICFPQSGRAG
ncbi:MAG TPA: tetraacyldisaccharide 4'-kinase, partial [Opitutus sp.]|nr:tetraacyldisaccharide 4'-kinase [Opitutus sp.]